MSRRSLREQFSDLLAICNNDEERDILEWLWGYYAGPAERNEERLARELGVASASLQLTLNGALPASELPDMLPVPPILLYDLWKIYLLYLSNITSFYTHL